MAIKKEYITHSAEETQKLGSLLAENIKSKVLICLTGDLGGGKTIFTQGFARGLGIQEKITSPSFVLLKKYQIPDKKLIKTFYHLDCYRLKNPEEIFGIGYEEILEDRQAVIVIEWAERIKRCLPLKRINIEFVFVDQNKRKVIFRL